MLRIKVTYINIEIPAELHKKLKKIAINKDGYLKNVVCEALEEYATKELK